MECKDITALLSGYIDETLTPRIKEQVDKHIAACPACAGELSELKAVVNRLHGLHRVKAPADFLQNVLNRVEKPSLLERIRRRYILPLRKNISYEIIGVALTLAIIIAVPELVKQSTRETQKTTVPQLGVSTTRPPQETLKKEAENKPVINAPDDEGAPKTFSEEKSLFDNSAQHERSDAISATALQNRKIASSPMLPAMTNGIEPSMFEEINVSYDSGRNPDSVSREISDAIKKLGGADIKSEYGKADDEPLIVYARLPRENLPLLYKEISKLGTVNAPRQTPPATNQKTIPVKIYLKPSK